MAELARSAPQSKLISRLTREQGEADEGHHGQHLAGHRATYDAHRHRDCTFPNIPVGRRTRTAIAAWAAAGRASWGNWRKLPQRHDYTCRDSHQKRHTISTAATRRPKASPYQMPMPLRPKPKANSTASPRARENRA